MFIKPTFLIHTSKIAHNPPLTKGVFYNPKLSSLLLRTLGGLNSYQTNLPALLSQHRRIRTFESLWQEAQNSKQKLGALVVLDFNSALNYYENYLQLKPFLKLLEQKYHKLENIDWNNLTIKEVCTEQLSHYHQKLQQLNIEVVVGVKNAVAALYKYAEKDEDFAIDESRNPHLQTIKKQAPDCLKRWQQPLDLTKEQPNEVLAIQRQAFPNLMRPMWYVGDSDDWEDMLLLDHEVSVCTSIFNTTYGVCALAYLLDGKLKPLVIRKEDGKIIAQATCRLLWDEEASHPVILLDMVYTQMEKLLALFLQLILLAARTKAKQLGIPLLTSSKAYDCYLPAYDPIWKYLNAAPYQNNIKSLGGPVPYEHVDTLDAYDTQSRGKYKISNGRLKVIQKCLGDATFNAKQGPY